MTITTAARRIAREHNRYFGSAFDGSLLVFDREGNRDRVLELMRPEGAAWHAWLDAAGLVVVRIDASRRMTQREAQALLDGIDPDDL